MQRAAPFLRAPALLVALALATRVCDFSFAAHGLARGGRISQRRLADYAGGSALPVCGPGVRTVVAMAAAKKKKALGEPIADGDTVYIKVHTGRYVGELEGTSKKEWVKARGKKKDDDHALTIEKRGGGEVETGDQIKLVMPLSVTNGTKVHMDVVGSAVRARYYDPRGEWQKITIIKYYKDVEKEGPVIRNGDTIFLKSVFMNGRDYLDANPLEKAPDGELKCRWPDEGEWQVMTIEK